MRFSFHRHQTHSETASNHYRSSYTHPVRDWWIGLLILAVIVFGGALGSGYLFFTYFSVEVTPYSEQMSLKEYDEVLSAEATTLYRSRAERYDNILDENTVLAQSVDSNGTEDVSSTSSTSSTSSASFNSAEVEEEGIEGESVVSPEQTFRAE